MNNHGYIWLETLFPPDQYPNHVVMAIGVGLLLAAISLIFFFSLSKALRSPGGGLVPDNRLSFRNFFEIIAEKLYQLTQSVIGHHNADRYFPVVATLFVFIFTNNILGLIPGVLPATENLNTTLAIGVFVFFYYNIEGFRANGVGYLKHFMGPVIWLAPLLFIIEVASALSRPFSLGMRLRGNIYGDHMVLSVFNGLVPYLIPVIFYGLGVFVSFLQAFVFCLMTMVYISLSTAHDH
jgi:F-type H+-transporting ATPase subunit a